MQQLIHKVKFLGLLLAVIAVVIFVLQNTATVDLRFLFWQFSSALALVVFLTLALGFAIGLVVGRWLTKPKADRHPPKSSQAN